MGWLEGQVALVTGGASGLGRAIVERFIAEGARVAILDRAHHAIERIKEDLREHKERLLAFEGDVTNFEDDHRAVAVAAREWGKLDCFVGNAGIWDFSTALAALPADGAKLGAAFDEVFGINVKGCLFGARAAMAALLRSRGNIIFTVSNAGFYPDGGGPLYTASKHAVVGLVRQLAYELAPKVRVNGVAPGPISTDLRGPQSLGMAERSIGSLPLEEFVRRSMPLGRVPAPADYAGIYVLLASAANASTTTGTVINCDGGMGVRGFVRTAGGENL
jgi:cis-2,3-dihydrobiphenyl-2,3-diol dehydrogenase